MNQTVRSKDSLAPTRSIQYPNSRFVLMKGTPSLFTEACLVTVYMLAWIWLPGFRFQSGTRSVV